MSEKKVNPAGQKKSGKLTASERIQGIVDNGSFVEIDKSLRRSNAVMGYRDVTAPGEGVVAGFGTIENRPVCIFAQDSSVLKGSLGAAHAGKLVRTIELAVKCGAPLVCVWDSDGARVQEGAAALNGYGTIIRKLAEVSGVIPTISVVAGNMFGAASMFASLTDFTIVIDKLSAVSVYGPMVLAATEGKDVDPNALCGAEIQAKVNGSAQFMCNSENEAFDTLKELLEYLPSNNLDECPVISGNDEAPRAVSVNSKNAEELIKAIADDGRFMQVQELFADDFVIGFCKLAGNVVGIVANAPGKYMSIQGCRKSARFISFLDAYQIPVISLINNDGVEASLEKAQGPQARSLAKLAFAYAGATTPMLSVVTGKAIGEGYVAMGTHAAGADTVYAWPEAIIACLEPEAGALVMMDNKSATAEYIEKFASADVAAELGVVDAVIKPEDTRSALIAALNMMVCKREQRIPKKHGVSPL